MKKIVVLAIDYAALILLAIVLLLIVVPVWVGSLLWKWYRRMELHAFYDGDEEKRRKAEWGSD